MFLFKLKSCDYVKKTAEIVLKRNGSSKLHCTFHEFLLIIVSVTFQ